MEEIAVETLLRFLWEDVVFEDVTSEALTRGCVIRSAIIAEDKGVVAGSKLILPLLRRLGLDVLRYVEDGGHVERGSIVLEVCGEARTILTIERTVLDFLTVLSGIASHTRRLVEAVRRVDRRVIIAATGELHPGLGYFEKYAVAVGVGVPIGLVS